MLNMEKSQENILSRIFCFPFLSVCRHCLEYTRYKMHGLKRYECVVAFAICVSCLLACRKLWLIFYSCNIKKTEKNTNIYQNKRENEYMKKKKHCVECRLATFHASPSPTNINTMYVMQRGNFGFSKYFP